MKLISSIPPPPPHRPAYLDTVYRIELTGEELLRIFDLSMSGEGGPKHAPGTGGKEPRFAKQIADLLPFEALANHREDLVGGKYKP